MSATLCADPIAQTSAFWITGQESGSKDDDHSKVSCPSKCHLVICLSQGVWEAREFIAKRSTLYTKV